MMTVRGLKDGRIIVAGGMKQQPHATAPQKNTMNPDAPDVAPDDTPEEDAPTYDYVPSNDYAIYDPATSQWHTSASSQGQGGVLAILDDGRVVRYAPRAKDTTPAQDPPSGEGVMEISSADGTSWRPLDAKVAPIVGLSDSPNLFVYQNELFLAGTVLHSDRNALQWFNASTRTWETLWENPPGLNWRNHVGLIIVRTLANGKHVLLPVGGL